MLLACATSALLLGGPRTPMRHPAVAMAAIGANKAAEEAQKAEYFAMLPWEVPTRIELPFGMKSSLDLRAFVQPFNRSDAVMSGVWVCQEGVSREKVYPQPRKNGKDEGVVFGDYNCGFVTSECKQTRAGSATPASRLIAVQLPAPPVHVDAAVQPRASWGSQQRISIGRAA